MKYLQRFIMTKNIALRSINRFLKPFRLRIQRINSGLLLKEALFRKMEIKFIQIGANDGIRFDDLYSFVTDGQWTGLVIEPLPSHFKKLCQNYKHHPNVKPLNIGIHPLLKEAKIYSVLESALNKYPKWVDGCTSMNRNHLIERGVSNDDILESIVMCDPLMSVVEKYEMHDIDYLQIDTEGYDARILKSIDFTKLKPAVIKFEWMHLSQIEQNEIKTLLHSYGYTMEIDHSGSDCYAWLRNKVTI